MIKPQVSTKGTLHDSHFRTLEDNQDRKEIFRVKLHINYIGCPKMFGNV